MGEVVGGPDIYPKLSCAGRIWVLGDGTSAALIPGCLAVDGPVRFQRKIEYRHSYAEPGTYEVQVTYGPLTSNPILVEVL